MSWKNFFKTYAPLMLAVLMVVCMMTTLLDYKTPVYASEKPEAEDQTAKKDKDKDADAKEETKAVGSFELADGVYEGTGTGFAGKIKVAVTIAGKQITAIEILEVEADDTAFFERAKGVIDKIIQSQSVDVDVVSGATYSSNGIISAVKNALTGEQDTGETQAESTQSDAAAAIPEAVVDAAAYKDGTYYGTGTGFSGTTTVAVTIADGKIASIEVVSTGDGSSYIEAASGLIGSIISTQSTNVDTVSGATFSSSGIIQAVRNALAQAAVDAADTNAADTDNTNKEPESNSNTITGTIMYNEGIYYGTAEGYLGDITVAVVIKNHTINTILVTKAEDDEAFFNRAVTVVDNIVEKQSVEVDTVSGATYSSKGLIQAVKNALAEADKVTNGGGSTDDNKPGTDDPDDEKPGTDEPENPDEEKPGTDDPDVEQVYKDGEYFAAALCEPDEDEDFEAYTLSLKLIMKQDKITEISNIKGDGDSANDSYIKRAANGTSKIAGVTTQILESNSLDEIDTVSRATCSSKSIIEACKAALDEAKQTTGGEENEK